MTTVIEPAAPRAANTEPPEENPPVPVSGILDVGDKNAFIRATGYLPGPGDTYLSAAQVARYGLRPGDHVEGVARSPRSGNRREKFRNLVRLDTVNGRPANDPENTGKRPAFADLTPELRQSTVRRMNSELKARATKTRAEGEQRALEIRATADKESTVLLADARRKAQATRGEGDKEAIRIYGEAFSKDKDFYEFTRSLEAYKNTLASPDTRLILSPDSEFLQYLRHSQ